MDSNSKNISFDAEWAKKISEKSLVELEESDIKAGFDIIMDSIGGSIHSCAKRGDMNASFSFFEGYIDSDIVVMVIDALRDKGFVVSYFKESYDRMVNNWSLWEIELRVIW